MPHRQPFLKRLILILTLLMGLAALTPAEAQDNLLENGGFEGTYVSIGGDPALQVAPNWQPWSLPPPEGAPSSQNLRPDYQPSPANRVRSGNAAQEYNTFFATHDGGVYQRVPVSPGAELEFSVYVYVWSSATFEDPDQSTQPQDVDVQVGIDPNGGQDGSVDSIVWSDAIQFYDEYRELTVSATAQGNAVTVFVRTAPQGSIGVNNIYVDDASLIQTGQSDVDVEPTQEVSDTAEATDEATTEATEEATTESTAEATTEATEEATDTPEALAGFPNRLTYVVQPGDTVLAIATANSSTVEAISAANGLDDVGFIVVGQSLVIPVPAGIGQPAATATTTDTTTTDTTTDTTTTGAAGQHVVQPGENLFRIALQYNTTVETLATLNNITNPNAIVAGTILQVPVTTPATPQSGSGGAGGTINATTHVVQAGENAYRIALRYNLTVEQIALANGITNPNLIYTGQALVIPR